MTDLAEPIRKAARSVAFAWPGVVEADDIEQAIWLRLLESPSTETRLLEADDRDRRRALLSVGHQIANRERDDYDHFTGNFRYSVNEVKALLQRGGLDNLDPSLRSGWSSEEMIDGEFEDTVLLSVSMDTDLRRAMEKLEKDSPQYHEILIRRYVEGEAIPKEESPTLARAHNAATDAMNRSHKRQHAERPDGPGTRLANTNSERI